MWKLSYELPKGKRRKKYGWAITTRGDRCWYNKCMKEWVSLPGLGDRGSSSHLEGIKTEKEFLRHLRKHDELRGQEVTLVSRYDGCNIVANWVKD